MNGRPGVRGMTPAARRLRVLLVEDDERIRSLIADILGTNVEIEGAADAEQARELLGGTPRRRFDLAIIDCLLPAPGGRVEPRGIALVGDLHAQRPALPILAITGASHAEGIIVDAFRMGARDLLRKPFGVDELRTSVARLTLRVGRRLDSRPRARIGVARVLTFLSEHVGQSVSLTDLARVAAMSRSHLSRTFRDAVGIPLRVYVRNLRLERAQQMLVSSPRASLTEVALEAGFYDLPHFDKAFRERFGVSPSEFLRRRELERVVELRKSRRRPA